MVPFKSKRQRRWMYANKPEMAKRWEKHTPKGKKLPEKVAALTTLQRVGAGLSNIGKVFAGKKLDERIQRLQIDAALGDESAQQLLNILGIASIAAGAAGGLGTAKALGARGGGLAFGTAAGSLLGALPMAAAKEREPDITLPGFDVDMKAAADRMSTGRLNMLKAAASESLLKLDAKGISLPALQALYGQDLESALQHPGVVALVARRKERVRRLMDELKEPGSHLKVTKPKPGSPEAPPEEMSMMPGQPMAPGLPQPPSNLLGMFGPAGGAPGQAGGGGFPGMDALPKISARIDAFFKRSNGEGESEEEHEEPEPASEEKKDVPEEITPQQSQEIQTFATSQPNLDDTKFHNYVEGLGVDPHEAEEIVYRLVRSLAQGGSENDLIPGGRAMGMPDAMFPAGQIDKGVEVELEHTPNKAHAKEIAKDHLTESTQYYDRLGTMEKKIEDEGDKGVGKRVEAYKYGFFVKFAELGIMPSELGVLMEKSAGTVPFLAGQTAASAAGKAGEEAGGLAKWLLSTAGKTTTTLGVKLPVILAILSGLGLGIGYRSLTAPGYAEPAELRHLEQVGLYRQLGREARKRARRLQQRRLERTGAREKGIEVPEIEAA